MKNFEKLLFGYSILVCFAWSIVSFLYPPFVLVFLFPSLLLLFIISRGNKKLQIFLLPFLAFLVLINVTIEKNFLVFPILNDGHVVFYADEYIPPSGVGGLRCNPPYGAKFNVKYDVSITRPSHQYETDHPVFEAGLSLLLFLSDAGDTRLYAYLTDFPSDRYNVFNYERYEKNSDSKYCREFSKPLVSWWANILEAKFIFLFAFSYILLISYLLGKRS